MADPRPVVTQAAAGRSNAGSATRASGAAPDVLPRAFGRYTLFDRVGRGGMADIYLARAKTELGGARHAVVKQILPTLSGDPSFCALLAEEAKLAAGLSHANIVQVFDLGRERDRLYIAMEYVEGFDLNQLLRRLSKARIALPARFALHIVREVLKALDYAHRARDEREALLGVVHRDVSPSNVLISFEGEVKLCDFGIARALNVGREEPDQSVVRSARVVGKSAYMAPEHARGEEIDLRADLFSAGVILWELCAGRRLYRGDEGAMLEQARRGEVDPLPDRGLPDPGRLQALVSCALAPRPEDRFASSAEMLGALEDYIIANDLAASPLKFGAFLTEHFSGEIVRSRRARERAAAALERGPLVVMTPIAGEGGAGTGPPVARPAGEDTGRPGRLVALVAVAALAVALYAVLF